MLPVDTCRTVKVTARLRHGVVIPTRFPAPLDGILASAARTRRLGVDHDVDHHVEPLPLTGTLRSGWGHQRWVWAATCAHIPPTATTDVRHIHRRTWAEIEASSVGITGDKVPATPEVGQYKAMRIPVVATNILDVEWWCVGNPDRIGDLLADVTGIGKKVNIGEGDIVRWTVTDVGAPDTDAVMWHPDGRISRPVPVRHADRLGVTGCDTETVDAYRPPYFRAAMSDTGRRQPVEVIASWTVHP